MEARAVVTIQQPIEELYRFWRDFSNLPRIIRHLALVSTRDGRSHWVVRGPMGLRLEWDAEVTEDRPNERIAWRSLQVSDVWHAGIVEFHPAPADRGTEVRATLEYRVPGGRLGSALLKAVGEEPSQQLQGDLRRFKQIMEAGEVATVEGQPSGRRAGPISALVRWRERKESEPPRTLTEIAEGRA